MESKKTVEVLNDLIEINNDRIEGYTKAIDQTDKIDADLRNVFENCREHSISFKNDLSEQVRALGGNPDESTNFTGELHRTWMDIKQAFRTEDREAILESCEYGDKQALKTYGDAIETFSELPQTVNQTIMSQKSTLESDYNKIQTFQNAQENLNDIKS